MRRTEPDFTTAARLGAPVPDEADPVVEASVHDIIGRVADSMDHAGPRGPGGPGTLRFTELSRLVGGVSQTVLTKTVRQMECDGLVSRTVHPVVPPRVDDALTDLGRSLGAAFCGVWIWAETHRDAVARARAAFAAR